MFDEIGHLLIPHIAIIGARFHTATYLPILMIRLFCFDPSKQFRTHKFIWMFAEILSVTTLTLQMTEFHQ